MNRRWTRGLAALAAAVMLLTQSAPNASANVTPFNAKECHVAAEGTPNPVQSWHFERLKMDRVWKIAKGEGVTVAVIDTGMAAEGSLYLQQADDKRFTTYDMLGGLKSNGNEQLEEFDCLHGTRVASLLAGGRAKDGRPLDGRVEFSGIAPAAKVIAYRTLFESHAPKEDDEKKNNPLQPTTDAVLDAVKRDVDIINLSQVVPETVEGFENFRDAIQLALNQGIVVVAAAGNRGQIEGAAAYPASFPGVISVGATTRNDAASDESADGVKVDIGAPGDGLHALEPSNYNSVRGIESQVYSGPITGTSYATPIVSGIVALMIEKQRKDGLAALTPAEVMQRLIETADPPPAANPDSRIGAGIVNPLRVLSGEVPQIYPNEGAETEIPAQHYPPPKVIDQTPVVVGLVTGVVAFMLVAGGIVAAIVVPRARKVAREDRAAR
ncbi:MAG: S8 family serine peptidase [Propionibacteriaceae bacterium]|nr:S8 family serine peptidase [Propionibacteriaceae bacterium]